MYTENLRRKNLVFLFLGMFFLVASGVFANFFLPFYLKERGLTILEIGFLFSVGLAFGHLLIGKIFSSLLPKMKLRAGFVLASVLAFVHSFVLFIYPSSLGVLTSKLSGELKKSFWRISQDVTIQHNTSPRNHRKVGFTMNGLDGFIRVFGLLLSLLLVGFIGFNYSFLFFSLLAIPSLFLFFKINDKTRFKPNKKTLSFSKTSKKLKLVLFSEIMYWLALGASFSLVVTFLVTDLFSQSYIWIGILFIGLYGSMSITSFISDKLLYRFDLVKVSILGMFVLFLSAVLIIVSKDVYFVLSAMILEGIGAGIWVPSKTAVYWGLVKKSQREKVSGYLGGWRGFVSVIGPVFGGSLVTYFGILSPFYFKATLALLIMFIYLYISKNDN